MDNAYNDFLKSKLRVIENGGFEVEESLLNEYAYDFQKYIISVALRRGKYAIFADCGLGKTLMQMEWANQICKRTGKSVLILAPLAVSGQTIKEGERFGINVQRFTGNTAPGIYITNYEQLEHIDADEFVGVVLDESSILKNFTGVYKNLLIDKFRNTVYKLCCTATPSPNDLNEIGNHSEFLDVLDAQDMRAKWFVRDEGMNNYRLKGHAKKDFYGWISSWATMITSPADIGFDGSKYSLPKLIYHEVMIQTQSRESGKLFNEAHVNATEFNAELRRTMKERFAEVAELVNGSKESFIVWVKQNEEADYVRSLIPDAVEVRGNESPEAKERKLLGFANDEFRVLITKAKIAQFGLNYQNCHNQVFASLDFSFEGLYQTTRRSYRYGQKHDVNIYLITTDTMENVIKSIKKKERQFLEMQSEMNKNINETKYGLLDRYQFEEVRCNDYWLMKGDSVTEIERIDDGSIDLSVFSPPFSSLFTYSNYIHDMGNNESHDDFFKQNGFLLKKLYNKMKNGRIVAVHTKDLAVYKNSSGYSGLYDFTGDYHRAMEKAGFKYHSKITIWTDPVLEMQRTKTQRLLHKQVTTDSTYSGVGLPEYVTIFRKWEGDESEWEPVTNLTKENFSIETWQKWASSVWMDIKRTDVLNSYTDGKDPADEKHIAPLQLEVIKRIVSLWSNRGECVFTPFLGIGSEAYVALQMGRKAVGIELKDSYFKTAVRNCNSVLAGKNQMGLAI